MSAAINFSRKLDLIKEHWTPKVIAQMNDYQFKLVKVQGDFSGIRTRIPTRPSSSWRANCASTCATAR